MTGLYSKLSSNSFIFVLLPIIFIPVIFYDTTLSMMRVWMVNETFTHGFLVFPLAIWLIWQKKPQLLLIKPCPEPGIFILLILLLTGWIVSYAVDVKIAQQLLMITIILTTIWIIEGRQVLFYVLFPLIFLYFAVPFGQVFIPTLMQYTANFTVAMIKMFGIPVYQDGLSFVLPSGNWSVVEECSGVRYLIASFSLGSIYAYLNYSSTKKRVIFILLSLIVPVIGNGLRAFGIVMIGHFSGMKLAVGADHLLYGWVFFGVIIFLLFYVGTFWRDADISLEEINANGQCSAGEQGKYSPFSVFLIAFVLMISFSIYAKFIEYGKQAEIKPVDILLPVDISGWQYDADLSLNWQPVFVSPDASINRGYSMGNDVVQLNIAYYRIQRQGAEAISTNNKITNPYSRAWKLVSSADIIEDDKHVKESELKYMDEKLLVWSWYRVGRYETPSPYMAKVLEAYNLIIEGRSDVSLLMIAAQVSDTKQTARQKIKGFLGASSEVISNELEQIQNEK